MNCCEKPLVRKQLAIDLADAADTLEVIRDLQPHDAEQKLTEVIEYLREASKLLK